MRPRRPALFTVIASVALAALASAQGRAERPAVAEPLLAPLPFDRILRFDEMSAMLKEWEAARPGLMQLESVGTTPRGREMWLATLTTRATGPAAEKPALVVDGNEHATEWAGGVAALHLVHRLLSGYGEDERITRLLDSRAVYVLPRMTPDGVEATLAQGRFIRSVDRPWPYLEPEPGIHAGDVDGDGRTVFMRLLDPNGPWRTYAAEERLLVPRGPGDEGGEAWRVLPEGTAVGWNGETIADPPALEALDFGSNFPGDRGSAAPGRTEGPYPTSEPEVAAYVAAIAARPNVVAHVTCHTFGGLVLTPPVNLGERLPSFDRQAYATLAGKAAELTGYRAMSYLDLRATDQDAYIPSAFGWLYDRRGVYSFITEFWNPLAAAGISLEGTTASAWLWGFHPIADEVKLLRWNDTQVGGAAFVPWRPFRHPQLGDVEIGGFDLVRAFYNVPFDRLEREVAPHSEWVIWLGLALPRLQVRSFAAEPVSDGVWRVRLAVENQGWLPTSGTQKAVDQGAVGGVRAEVALPAGARLLTGEAAVALGQLAGRSEQRSVATWWGYRPGTPDRALAEWLVAAPAGTRIEATARHERAGTARAELVLGHPQR